MNGFFDKKEHSFEELVYRGVESDELDYKARMSWRTMTRAAKGKLLRHLIAFANTRGGYLVIGVGEDQFGNPNLCTGVSKEEAGSFDPSAVGSFVNSHVEPPIDFTIERPVIRGKKYVIFVIRPFKRIPHVCTSGIEGEIQSGVFYIRTVEASSRPARRAMEMQELIHRALRNEREALANVLQSVLQEAGLAAPQNIQSGRDDAIEASEHYFHRRTSSFELPQIKFTASLSKFMPGSFTQNELRSAFGHARRKELNFLHENEAEALPTPGSLRYISINARRMWQFFDSGLFCFFAVLPETALSFSETIRLCAVAADFFSRLFTALKCSDENLQLTLEIVNPQKLTLTDKNRTYKFTSTLPCRAEYNSSAAEIAAAPALCAAKIAAQIAGAYQLDDAEIKALTASAAQYLEQK